MSAVTGAASRSSAVQELRRVWQYRALIANFAERELKSKYKRSLLGWTWSLINPAATLLIYTVVFSTIFRAEPPVAGNGTLTSYTVYLFIALIMWNFFAGVVNTSQAALIGAGPLLKKIYFPPFAPVLGNGISVLVQTGIELLVLLVLLLVLVNISWTVLLVVPLVALLAVFSLGVGLVFSLLNVYYRDIGYLVSLGLQLAFYATPVLYPPDLIPDVTSSGIPAKAILQLNPMYHYVQAARDLLWHLSVPTAGEWLLLLVMSVVSFGIGWLVFHSRARDVSEEL